MRRRAGVRAARRHSLRAFTLPQCSHAQRRQREGARTIAPLALPISVPFGHGLCSGCTFVALSRCHHWPPSALVRRWGPSYTRFSFGGKLRVVLSSEGGRGKGSSHFPWNGGPARLWAGRARSVNPDDRREEPKGRVDTERSISGCLRRGHRSKRGLRKHTERALPLAALFSILGGRLPWQRLMRRCFR